MYKSPAPPLHTYLQLFGYLHLRQRYAAIDQIRIPLELSKDTFQDFNSKYHRFSQYVRSDV